MGVPDLSRLKETAGAVTGEVPYVGAAAPEAKILAEKHAGMRCGGCGRRVERGFEFLRFVLKADVASGENLIRKQTTVACAGVGGCKYAEEAAVKSVAVREVTWQFLDQDPAALAQANAMIEMDRLVAEGKSPEEAARLVLGEAEVPAGEAPADGEES